jgi:TetR/AcrR family transcriptional repressor of lmrAB and yxaGH operons
MVSNSRDRIMETTCTLLEVQGYQATGLNQIIRESGAPRGSLYYYFPGGKEGLVAEAVARTGVVVRERIEHELDAVQDTAAAVEGFVRSLAKHVEVSGFRSGGPIATAALEASATSERVRTACAET